MDALCTLPNGHRHFDFEGIYTDITTHKLIKYTLGDDRKVGVHLRPTSIQLKLINILKQRICIP